MKAALLILAALPAFGQSRQVFLTSQGFAVAGAVADVRSSWGAYELNPVLGCGQFGPRQAALSLAITSALVLAETPLTRRHPALRKPFTVINFVVGSVRFGVAIRNSQQR